MSVTHVEETPRIKTYIVIFQDPVYTTSAGEITEISDPAWLGQLSAAVSALQSLQYTGVTTYPSQYTGGYVDNQG